MRRLTLFLFLVVLSVFGLLTGSCASRPPPLSNLPKKSNDVKIKIDRDFTLMQQFYLERAFRKWETALDNKVKFTLIWNQKKPAKHRLFSFPTREVGVFFWYLPKEKDQVPEEWIQYDGVTVYGDGQKSGNIIVFEQWSEERFYTVALHEIGHFLGLKHIDVPGAIMYYRAGSMCITEFDARQLCDIYNCQPKAECFLE